MTALRSPLSRRCRALQEVPGEVSQMLSPEGRGAERGGGGTWAKMAKTASTSPVTRPRGPALHAIWPCSASTSHPQGSHSPLVVSLLPERSPSCWLI